jgi:hypothetical protein
MAETPLNALGVVEGLDVVEERGSQLSAGRPLRVVVDPGEFAFEGGEERLDGGVVVAAADGAERLVELKCGEARGEGQRRVDRAAIGVVHYAAIGSATLEGHEQGVADELGVDRWADCPADDAT